jgi:crotonobetainyl-CoA:carnitine CoA-transferase CaiB-like acyl-CoA transferase
MLLQGLRVVEMGFWVAGPAAAGLLADWGADVVKIERMPQLLPRAEVAH